MPTRNTGLLTSIVQALGDVVVSEEEALARLEQVFADQLLMVASDVQAVARYAEELRLAVTMKECAAVLDDIGIEALAGIKIDQVEEVINCLYPGRFIEP